MEEGKKTSDELFFPPSQIKENCFPECSQTQHSVAALL